MPIYLVRWPDLSASLVRARHEDDLIDTLDQVANPEGMRVVRVRGATVHRLPAAGGVAHPG